MAKIYAKVDSNSKFINPYTVSDASVHDSQALTIYLSEKTKNKDY